MGEADPRHLPGTEGAAVVETPYLREVRVGVRHMARTRGVLAVDGVPGLGKTFATDLVARSLGLPLYWVDMPDRPKGKETTARVLKALTGRTPSPQLSEFLMMEEVVDLLTGHRCVLVVDEAQNLNVASLRQLRYLHDRRESEFVLALVGCDVVGHVARSVPELASRVGRRVAFRPFEASEMRGVLDAYHPLFRNTSGEALQVLWAAAGGTFRNWARVLEATQSLGLGEADGLSPAVARAVLRAVNGPARSFAGGSP